MGHYVGDLHLVVSPGDELFCVGSDLQYYFEEDEFTIAAKGFKSDLATIPALFRPFISPTGKLAIAAVTHDSLYNKQVVYNNAGERRQVDRKEADKIFMKAMKDLNVNTAKRQAIYFGVRSAGWLYWNKCKGCQ